MLSFDILRYEARARQRDLFTFGRPSATARKNHRGGMAIGPTDIGTKSCNSSARFGKLELGILHMECRCGEVLLRSCLDSYVSFEILSE